MHVTAMVLQIILGLMFLMAGFSKLKDKKQIDAFSHYGYPQWFRVTTGFVEWIGAIGMILGIWYPELALLAGIWLGITMLVAVITHIRVGDSFKTWSLPLLLLVLNAVIVVLQWYALVNR
ncbi:MAG: DoxX family protein [Alicyclobacillus sp.]|nr:DoxX family protein [Alicyclobacillus sp.]